MMMNSVILRENDGPRPFEELHVLFVICVCLLDQISTDTKNSRFATGLQITRRLADLSDLSL